MGIKISPWHEGHEGEFIYARGEVFIIVKDLIVARYPVEGFRKILTSLDLFITTEIEKEEKQKLNLT